MEAYTQEAATDIVFPNITVYRRYLDGVHCAFEVYSNEGYVMYDTTANVTELDPDTMEEIPVTYYCTWITCPASYNFDNFPWAAVPINSQTERTEADQ